MKQILVSDSLFIYEPHVLALKDAGYEVVRVGSELSEEELCKAIKGKTGYILGGIEKVTDKVIESADKLEAIMFPGIGWKYYIPGWEKAKSRGIKIANAPDVPTHACAEWLLSAALYMNRQFSDLTRTGNKAFTVTSGLEGKTIGIVGYGRIGKELNHMLQVFRPKEIVISNRSTLAEEKERQVSSSEVFAKCDVVFLTVGEAAGANFITKKELSLLNNNALVVSIMRPGMMNSDNLYDALSSGAIRAMSVNKEDARFSDLPLSVWNSMNDPSVSVTEPEVQAASDAAVKALLNLLNGNDEPHRVV